MTPAKIKILMIIATFKHPEFPRIAIKPTVREIAKLADCSSTTVHEHLQVLLKGRWLKKCTQVNSKRVYALTPRAKDLLFDTVVDENERIATKISQQFTKIINKYARHSPPCDRTKGNCTCGLWEAIKDFV